MRLRSEGVVGGAGEGRVRRGGGEGRERGDRGKAFATDEEVVVAVGKDGGGSGVVVGSRGDHF